MKLAARRRDLPALRRALSAMSSAEDKGRAKLISTYYDTPDRALGRRRMSLRVRGKCSESCQAKQEHQQDEIPPI